MPGQLLLCGDVQKVNCSLTGSSTFVVRKPKGFVPSVVEFWYVDRPSGNEAGLVLSEFALVLAGNIVEKPVGIQRVVAEKPKDRPMEVIRSGLADDVDLIRAETIFSRISGRLFLEFLNCIYG